MFSERLLVIADSTDNQANPGDVGPEGANMTAGLGALVAWRDEFEPELEVWLTEFGCKSSAHKLVIHGSI